MNTSKQQAERLYRTYTRDCEHNGDCRTFREWLEANFSRHEAIELSKKHKD